jgi:hypothetical protein
MTKTLVAVLLAAVLGLFGGLAMHPASAVPAQSQYTTKCTFGSMSGTKPLTASDLEYMTMTCDTTGN